jgi:hypothetical protein
VAGCANRGLFEESRWIELMCFDDLRFADR